MKYLGKTQFDEDLITKGATLFPDFDGLDPIATYTFSTSSAKYYKIFSRKNTGLASSFEFTDTVLFRITVTGVNISQKVDVIVKGTGSVTQPNVYAINSSNSISASTTGIYYLRSIYPKALNSGYDWVVEFYPYNSTARTVKIEVFRTTDNITWETTLTQSTYNSTYQTSATISFTELGLRALGNVPITTANANVANVVNSLLAFTSAASTLPIAGEAIVSGIGFFTDDAKAYNASNKTQPINTEVGLLKFPAKASGSPVYWYEVSQKTSMTPSGQGLSYGTLTARLPVYLRCTVSDGKVYSDAYLSQTMAGGYTWCYVGMVQNGSSIATDLTHCVFLSLDENGNLTHVNGKRIIGNTPKSVSISLPANGWANNEQAVTVPGILSDETKQLIQPVPASASRSAYEAAGVEATAQGANSMIFTCTETPTAALTVYVVITEVVP